MEQYSTLFLSTTVDGDLFLDLVFLAWAFRPASISCPLRLVLSERRL